MFTSNTESVILIWVLHWLSYNHDTLLLPICWTIQRIDKAIGTFKLTSCYCKSWWIGSHSPMKIYLVRCKAVNTGYVSHHFHIKFSQLVNIIIQCVLREFNWVFFCINWSYNVMLLFIWIVTSQSWIHWIPFFKYMHWNILLQSIYFNNSSDSYKFLAHVFILFKIYMYKMYI